MFKPGKKSRDATYTKQQEDKRLRSLTLLKRLEVEAEKHGPDSIYAEMVTELKAKIEGDVG